jgi:hypothetical protein
MNLKYNDLEESYYSEMEDISRIQTAHFTSNKMFKAFEQNNFDEFKRLYELDAENGGLILIRLIAKNKDGKSFLEYAKILGRTAIVEYIEKKQTQ